MEPPETLHGKRHGLRTFLFEIFTVTVGLFIALALNDLVEWHSHRQLVRTAESSLRNEIQSNRGTVVALRKQIAAEQQQMHDDLAVLARMRAQLDAPGSPPHVKLGFQFRILGFGDTAWRTAQTTGAFGFMPYQDVAAFSDIYDTQNTVFQAQQQAVDGMLKAAAIVVTKPQGASMTRDEIDETARRIGEVKMRLFYLGDLVDALDLSYREYAATHR